MPRCIYCQQERSEEFYTKAEHVLPQSFGRFRQNMTLHHVVCDLCNKYFGDNLEIHLARDTFEGQLRFDHGIKDASEFKTMGRRSRMILKSTEGEFAGCYMERFYSEEQKRILVKPLPQVGFMLAPANAYRYFLLDQIPTKDKLDAAGYDPTHAQPIIGLVVDPQELAQRLAEKGIAFRYRGPLMPASRPDSIGCELDGNIDSAIFRAVSKVAFNYLAYWEGSEFVQQRAFDKARRYIRWAHAPGYKMVHVDEIAILANEPIEGPRLQGHLVTMNWAGDGVSVLVQVALFNWMTYRISLAQDFTGPPPALTRGHFFNVNNQEILELEARPRQTPLPVEARAE